MHFGVAFVANLQAAELLWMQEMTPDNHPAVGGEPLIGETDSDGRRAVIGVNVQAHRLVRLRKRQTSLFCRHTTKPTQWCPLFQPESFRLR